MSLLPRMGKCFNCGHDHGEGLGSPRELELIGRIAELERQVAELRDASSMARDFLQEHPRSERQADVLRFVDAALAQAKTEGANG